MQGFPVLYINYIDLLSLLRAENLLEARYRRVEARSSSRIWSTSARRPVCCGGTGGTLAAGRGAARALKSAGEVARGARGTGTPADRDRGSTSGADRGNNPLLVTRVPDPGLP